MFENSLVLLGNLPLITSYIVLNRLFLTVYC